MRRNSAWCAVAWLCAGAACADASIEQIAEGVRMHIDAEAAAGDGYFRLMHEDEELRLKLVRVHMEYLADLGDGVQFACVDLVHTDGTVYDVDFFLRGEPGDLDVTETTVHKVNGRPVYVWEQEDDGTWKRVTLDAASERLLGVITGEDEFEFLYRVRLPELNGNAKLWLPLAQSDDFQTVQVLGINVPAPAQELREHEHGNTVLFMTLGPEHGGQPIEIRYRVRRVEKASYPAGGENPREHLAPERLVPDDDTFRAIAQEVIEGKDSELDRARALYDHAVENIRYARYGDGWGQGDALYACDARSGNCTDFHAYFIALARAADIPARFIMGAAIPSERDDGGIDGYHCWAEFYADGQWWPVDVSEANKNISLASYFFGRHPANRIQFSRGRDLLVEPGPAGGPINFLGYPVLEEEGRPKQAPTEFLFRRLGG